MHRKNTQIDTAHERKVKAIQAALCDFRPGNDVGLFYGVKPRTACIEST